MELRKSKIKKSKELSKMKTEGCSFGRESRQMIVDIKDDVKEIKEGISNLSNHYSSRLPTWTSVVFGLLLTLLGLLAGIKLS